MYNVSGFATEQKFGNRFVINTVINHIHNKDKILALEEHISQQRVILIF